MDTMFYIEDGIEVAPSPFLKPLRDKGYGVIPDLPEEELAEPDELERAAFLTDYEPLLLLPKRRTAGYNPALDWSNPDFNAFLSMDFSREQAFDKARYKAGKLREKLEDTMIMARIISGRIQDSRKRRTLRLVEQKIIEPSQIRDFNMQQLAMYYLRALRLKEEIARLEEASRHRKKREYERWLEPD